MGVGDFDTTPGPSAQPSLDALRNANNEDEQTTVSTLARAPSSRHHLLKTSTIDPPIFNKDLPIPPLLSKSTPSQNPESPEALRGLDRENRSISPRRDSETPHTSPSVFLAESFESSSSLTSANHNSLSNITHRSQIPEHVDRRLETHQVDMSGSVSQYHQSRSSVENRSSNHEEFSTRSGELHSNGSVSNPLTTRAQPVFPHDESYIRAGKTRPAHIYYPLHLRAVEDGADGDHYQGSRPKVGPFDANLEMSPEVFIPSGQKKDSLTTGYLRSLEPLSDSGAPILVEARPLNSDMLELRYRSFGNYHIPKVQPHQEVPRVVEVGTFISHRPDSGENSDDGHSLPRCDIYSVNTRQLLYSIGEDSSHAANAVEASDSFQNCLAENSLDIHTISRCENFPIALALDMHPAQACPGQPTQSKVESEAPGISATQACSNIAENSVCRTSATPCLGLDSPTSFWKRVVHWGIIPSGTFPHGRTSQTTDSPGRSQSLGSGLDYSSISKWLREIMKPPEAYSPKLTRFPTRSYSHSPDAINNGRVTQTLPQATKASRRDTEKSVYSGG
jgi:hypothetical protein